MRRVAAIGVVLLLSGGSAVAQTSPQPARPQIQNSPCEGQWEKICSAVPSGAGRKLICMTQHLSQLTPACSRRVQAIYKLESTLAARAHMTVSQYMQWGQSLVGQGPPPKVVPIYAKRAPAAPPPSQTNKSASGNAN